MMNLFLQLRYNPAPMDQESGSCTPSERCSNDNDVNDASKQEPDRLDEKEGERDDVVEGGKSINEGYDRSKGDKTSINMDTPKIKPGPTTNINTSTEKKRKLGAKIVPKSGQEQESTTQQAIATPTYFCTRTGVRFGRDIGKPSLSPVRTRNLPSNSPISEGSKQELKIASPVTTKRKRATTTKEEEEEEEEERPQKSRAPRKISSTTSITPPKSNNTIISNPLTQPKKPNPETHKTANKSQRPPTTTPSFHPAERRILEHAADILSEKSGSTITVDQLISITQQSFFTTPNSYADSSLEDVRSVVRDGRGDSDSGVGVVGEGGMYPSPPSSDRDFLVEGRKEGAVRDGEGGLRKVKRRRRRGGDISILAML